MKLEQYVGLGPNSAFAPQNKIHVTNPISYFVGYKFFIVWELHRMTQNLLDTRGKIVNFDCQVTVALFWIWVKLFMDKAIFMQFRMFFFTFRNVNQTTKQLNTEFRNVEIRCG
jgi:hypothetical protein